jgi:hypothetical protein
MWKDKPSWLKYGIYIAIAYPIVNYLLIFIGSFVESESSILATILFFPIFFMSLPAVAVHELFNISGRFIDIITFLVIGFIIGAIIGLIKKKK